MLKNYFKIAIRNLVKHKAFTIINIAGLAVGLTCCLLMAIYVRHELSYDKFQQKRDRIVRMLMEYKLDNAELRKGDFTSPKAFPAFKTNFPEVESGARMALRQRVLKKDKDMFTEKVMFADSTFFNLFSFKLLQGSPSQVLNGQYKIILTKSAAEKYYGKIDPVGKILKVGTDETNYLVTGIIEDCPSSSQMQFDCLASFSSLGDMQQESYWGANYTTFLLLHSQSDIAKLQQKVPAFMKKEMELKDNEYVSFDLEPFNRIHLHSDYASFGPVNNISYIYIVSAVAFLMLMIACFTYVNLSTARSIERAREVGIRKVAGALKSQVFGQFIGESSLISTLSLLISILLAYILLPGFGKLAERNFDSQDLFSPFTLFFSLAVIICISLFAGSYPAIILSRYKPVKVLKGSFKNTSSAAWLRKSLTVFQFVVSIFLIISAIIINYQLRYIQTAKLGFDKDHLVVLDLDSKMYEKLDLIKTELKANPGIISVASTVNDPSNIYGGYMMRSEEMPEGSTLSINATPIDQDFIKTVGIQLIAGEDFTAQDIKDVTHEDNKDNTYHFILNETGARAFGWTPQQAIGKKVFLGESRPGLVKGVAKDFHSRSMRESIQPIVMFTENWGSKLMVKISGEHIPETIQFLETKWKTLVPYRPFAYHFFDEDYNSLYSSEMRLGKILNIFTAIAILLACTGLFGLSAYSIQQRTKEIGIRKVLGASVPGIVMMLSKEFIALVIISLLIAFPLAWLLMQRWLEDFVYRINMSWWMFALAGFAAIVIAFLTVSVRSVKTALSNPVKSLRTE